MNYFVDFLHVTEHVGKSFFYFLIDDMVNACVCVCVCFEQKKVDNLSTYEGRNFLKSQLRLKT